MKPLLEYSMVMDYSWFVLRKNTHTLVQHTCSWYRRTVPTAASPSSPEPTTLECLQSQRRREVLIGGFWTSSKSFYILLAVPVVDDYYAGFWTFTTWNIHVAAFYVITPISFRDMYCQNSSLKICSVYCFETLQQRSKNTTTCIFVGEFI